MAASSAAQSHKIVLVGDFSVGKTTIFTRFKTGKAKDVSLNTRKECECKRVLTVDGKEISITLYDTAGMERFEGTIPPTYFRQARAVIFVYSITSSESINNIENWEDSVSPQRLEYVGIEGNLIRVLVGNKSDLEHERDVQRDRALTIAENYCIEKDLFFEISALEGYGFDEMFKTIVREIRRVTNDSPGPIEQTLSVSNDRPSKTSGGCGCTKK